MAMFHVKKFLGDRVILDHLLSDSVNDKKWLETFISDTENSFHPEIRMTVDKLQCVEHKEYKPKNPGTLTEAVGE